MEYRQLGASGIRVSEIALGNWVTHGGSIGNDTAHSCVRTALDCGINFFDTADSYERGKAEEVLGSALEGVKRSSCVLATKVFWAMSDDPNDRGLSRKHVLDSIHGSLRRLRTDYVDLYQAHRFDPDIPVYETLRAFEDIVRQGKALHVGVSEWTAEQIEEALEIADDMGFDRIVTNQPQYSILWRVPEGEVIPLCEREGIGQIVWSPLAMGVLTGKYEPGRPPPTGSRGASGGGVRKSYLRDETLSAVQDLKPIARDAGITMSQLALAWVLRNRGVSAAIVGASRPEQVVQNAEASGVDLDAGVMKLIDEAVSDVVTDDPSLTGG